MFQKRTHRIWTLIISCLLIVTGSPAFAAKPKQVDRQNVIWSGKSKDAELLFYGDSGLYWKSEDEEENEIIYRFDGNQVDVMDDFEGMHLESVEDDGIEVWSEPQNYRWSEFALYAKVGKKKYVLEQYISAPATNIRIDYPYIRWEAAEWSSKTTVEKVMNVEKKQVETITAFDSRSDRLLKAAGQDRWQWMRPFEGERVSRNAYPGYEAQYSQSQLIWRELGGVYLDEGNGDQGGYTRLSSHVSRESRIAMDNHYVAWNQEEQGLWFYSFEDDASYLVETINFSPNGLLTHGGKLAVLVRDDEEYLVQMFDLEDTKKTAKQKTTPVRLKPKMIDGMLAHLPVEDSPWQISASDKYTAVVLKDRSLLYQQRGDERIFQLEGYWLDPVVYQDRLFAYEMDERDLEDIEELTLYEIQLETGEKERIDSFGIDGFQAELKLNGNTLSWYQPIDEQIITMSLETHKKEAVDVGTDKLETRSQHGDSLVWIEKKKREYLLMRKEGNQAPQMLTKWSAEGIGVSQLSYNGTDVVWVEGIESRYSSDAEIVRYEISTGTRVVIDEVRDLDGPIHLQLSEDTVYYNKPDEWEEESPLYAYHLDSDTFESIGENISAFALLEDRLVVAQ
ncbi:MAG: hypothetical protein ACM32O_13355, partial [Clostridia bacterium]